MSDLHEIALAVFKLLGRVEWIVDGHFHKLYYYSPGKWEVGCQEIDTLTACLHLRNAALERLRERWKFVEARLCQEDNRCSECVVVVVRNGRGDGHTYHAPTLLEAVLKALKGEKT